MAGVASIALVQLIIPGSRRRMNPVWAIALPLVLLGIIGTLQTFPLIYMLTNGGPNHATESLPNYIFLQAFKLQSMGYASAISVVLMVVALLGMGTARYL